MWSMLVKIIWVLIFEIFSGIYYVQFVPPLGLKHFFMFFMLVKPTCYHIIFSSSEYIIKILFIKITIFPSNFLYSYKRKKKWFHFTSTQPIIYSSLDITIFHAPSSIYKTVKTTFFYGKICVTKACRWYFLICFYKRTSKDH